jgi:prevent-host-death family protein
MRTVSAADANRYFSRILQDVRGGETVVVTSRGHPVARIVPMDEGEREAAEAKIAEREEAWKEHLARLRVQPPLNIGRITRDEIYDD